MKHKRKKRSYMFTDKTHSIEAMMSVIIGIIILVTVLVLSIKSSQLGGNGPILYGIISFFAMIVSFAAFIVAAMTLRDKETFRVFPMLGTILNGVLFITLFVLYMMGFSL